MGYLAFLVALAAGLLGDALGQTDAPGSTTEPAVQSAGGSSSSTSWLTPSILVGLSAAGIFVASVLIYFGWLIYKTAKKPFEPKKVNSDMQWDAYDNQAVNAAIDFLAHQPEEEQLRLAGLEPVPPAPSPREVYKLSSEVLPLHQVALYRRGVNSFAAFCMRVVLWASAIPPDAMPEQLPIVHGLKDEPSPLSTTPAIVPTPATTDQTAAATTDQTAAAATAFVSPSSAEEGAGAGSGASGSSPRTRASEKKLVLADANLTYTEVERPEAHSTFSRRANATVWHPPMRSEAAGGAAGNHSGDQVRLPAEPRFAAVHDSADKYVIVEQTGTRVAPEGQSRTAVASDNLATKTLSGTTGGEVRLYTHNAPSYAHARASMRHSVSSAEIAAITALVAAAADTPTETPMAVVGLSARKDADVEPLPAAATPARTHSVSLSPIVVPYEQVEEGTQTDRASLILPVIRTLRNGRPAVDCECQTDATPRYPPLHTVLRYPAAAAAPADTPSSPAAIPALPAAAHGASVSSEGPVARSLPSGQTHADPTVTTGAAVSAENAGASPAQDSVVAAASAPPSSSSPRVPGALAASLAGLKSTRPAPAAPSSPLRAIAAPVLAGSPTTPPQSATPGAPLGESVAARRALFTGGRAPLLATRSEATLDIPMHAALVAETALAAAGLASTNHTHSSTPQPGPDVSAYRKPPPRAQKSTPVLLPSSDALRPLTTAPPAGP